ncbi:LutC/YkgG family protein [Propionibacteriaceae bacterium G1746]|uniref:LutC/YkgG family protein n=1 Tax=Aestuariimicrobium sp. G57 TaxID=3418485 RepID=UPI003C1C856B
MNPPTINPPAMTARDRVLANVRAALTDVTEADPATDVPITWTYGTALPTPDVLADFVEKVEDYQAVVVRVGHDQVAAALAGAMSAVDAQRVVLPAGLDAAWAEALRSSGVELVSDEPQLTHAELNEVDTVVTTCAVAMADSGTIALDHSAGQGRRALTLLPDRHVCIVRADQVVSDVPEGVAALAPAMRARRPVTWLSGGSATSDIELSRVEGVHGPRTLYVILVD